MNNLTIYPMAQMSHRIFFLGNGVLPLTTISGKQQTADSELKDEIRNEANSRSEPVIHGGKNACQAEGRGHLPNIK
jgi:hypothetical protein